MKRCRMVMFTIEVIESGMRAYNDGREITGDIKDIRKGKLTILSHS